MGVVPPVDNFLGKLRELCTQEGILLIFDEVMTGFRVALGGAQAVYNVVPDLTTLGKIIGGGLPVGAYGGKREIMSMVSPSGPVYQAGTLSGNPLAMSAGLATLKIIRDENPYPALEKRSAYLADSFAKNIAEFGIKATQTRVGSMMCMFFTDKDVVDYDTAVSSDKEKYGKYFHSMLSSGIYLAPSQFEAMFVSVAHTEADIEETIAAQRKAFESISR
jgi:glutamate-1-semialdehyde 2,1-aminomutase